MLLGNITQNGTGIIIKGDYFDLDNLYDTIHDLAKPWPEESFIHGQLMWFAYEIRKANQGSRELENVTPFNDEPQITYKSTKLVLISFLPTLKSMRDIMAFRVTSEAHHAAVYSLEALARQALSSRDSKTGELLYNWVQECPFTLDKYAAPLLSMATIDFLNTPLKTRFQSTLNILKRYFMYDKPRENAIAYLESEAKRLSSDATNLEFEWPVIKW